MLYKLLYNILSSLLTFTNKYMLGLLHEKYNLNNNTATLTLYYSCNSYIILGSIKVLIYSNIIYYICYVNNYMLT